MAKLDARTDPLDEHLRIGEAESADASHRAWKERLVRRALAECEDPSNLKPAEEVWRELGLEP